MFKIDKDVPISQPTWGRKYPFNELQAGESFFVPLTEGHQQYIRSLAWAYGKKHGVKFTCSTLTENGVRGMRVWRLPESNLKVVS